MRAAPEWAASGGKLALPLTLQFAADEEYFREGERAATFINSVSRDDEDSSSSLKERASALLEEPSFLVRPLNEPSFVSLAGVETVRVRAGRCSCASSVTGSGQHSLRFFLDFVSEFCTCRIKTDVRG